MAWLDENLFGLGEVPPFHCSLMLNQLLSAVELSLPVFKNLDTLVNECDGNLRVGITEDTLNVNLTSNFLTDFIRDALKQVLHLALVLVNVTGNCPDQLEAI